MEVNREHDASYSDAWWNCSDAWWIDETHPSIRKKHTMRHERKNYECFVELHSPGTGTTICNYCGQLARRPILFTTDHSHRYWKWFLAFPCLLLLVFVVARRCTVYESDRIEAGGAVQATKYGRKKWFIAHQRCTANEWKGPIRERRMGGREECTECATYILTDTTAVLLLFPAFQRTYTEILQMAINYSIIHTHIILILFRLTRIHLMHF